MDHTLVEFGVGGATAITIIKLTFDFVKSRGNGKSNGRGQNTVRSDTAGSQPISFWQRELDKSMESVLKPFLEQQREMLLGFKATEDIIKDRLTELVTIAKLKGN